ncbi:MAG: hypothetical protein AAFR66_15275 [Bacteroidota bacterium]
METVFRVCLLIAGIINSLPSILAFLPQKISDSYGIEIVDVNHELLLRHRAILFGIIGGIMIFSAISKKYYTLAVAIGMISMLSFVLLFLLMKGEVNPELRKVMYVDLIGIAVLLGGFILFRWKA